MPEGLRYFLSSGQAEESDREIPEKGHEDGSEAFSHSAFVLPEHDVPDPVKGLDFPVAANEGEQSLGRGFFRRKAGAP